MISREPYAQSAPKGLARDLVCALAASLCAGASLYFIYLLKPREFDILSCIKFMSMTMVAYFTVTFILHKFWVGALRRMLPSWILIAVFGSTTFVMIRLLPAIVNGWSGPTVTEPSLAGYITTEISAARSVIILLSIITLPITALVYYADSIIRGAKRWHDSEKVPDSILIPSSPRSTTRQVEK
jgi:hypothetical protein